MNFVKSFFILLLITVNIYPAQWFATPKKPETNILVKLAVYGGLVLGTGVCLYKYLSAPNDATINYKLDRKVGPDIKKKIVNQALEKFNTDLMIFQDKFKLLPALIPCGPVYKFKNIYERARDEFNKAFLAFNNLDDFHQKLAQYKGPIAIYACHITRAQKFSTVQELMNNKFMQSSDRFVKSKTHPRDIIGKQLLPEEYIIVGYSDGDMHIYLHPSDRRMLDRLSLEDRDLILGLYNAPSNMRTLTAHETMIFKKMPQAIQNNLRTSYDVQFDATPHFTLAMLGCFITAFGMKKMIENENSLAGFLLSVFGAATSYYGIYK